MGHALQNYNKTNTLDFFCFPPCQPLLSATSAQMLPRSPLSYGVPQMPAAQEHLKYDFVIKTMSGNACRTRLMKPKWIHVLQNMDI
jgi:hypothetical protein